MRIIDKIFKDKKSTCVIYILLTVGILLLVGGKTQVHTQIPQVEETAQIPYSLDSRMEEILSLIDGVGEVRVMIFFSGENEAPSSGILSASKEQETEEAQSVVVVADGADNATVREKIVRAVKSALGVESHKIEVFERKESQ